MLFSSIHHDIEMTVLKVDHCKGHALLEFELVVPSCVLQGMIRGELSSATSSSSVRESIY